MAQLAVRKSLVSGALGSSSNPVANAANKAAVIAAAAAKEKNLKMLGGVSDEALKLKEEVLASALPVSRSAREQIQKLQEQADDFTRKIELERRRVAELDLKIEETKSKIMEQRKKVGGVNAARENHKKIQKQTKVLESRLELALQKYNDAVLHNRTLKEQINDLRKERMAFDAIYKKLEKDLADKKREMGHIIEVSNKAYEARDAAVNEMARLKNQADREQQAFEAEWRDLGKLIDMDRKKRDTSKHTRTDQRHQYNDHRQNSLEQEAKLRKKVIKGNWNIAKDRVQSQVSMEKVQSYGEAFAKIQQATGITDIDELVDKFMNAEDENFRLFKYVDELNQEIAKFEEQINELCSEIEAQRVRSKDTQRKTIILDLEQRLHDTEQRTEKHQTSYEAAVKTVNAFKEGIVSIYNKIGCGTDETPGQLGEHLNPSSMLSYLANIESRTNEILHVYAGSLALLKGSEAHPGAAIMALGQGPSVPIQSGAMRIEPPSANDEEPDTSDEEPDYVPDDRPLSLAELQGKAQKNITKREGKDKKRRGKLMKQETLEH